MKLDVWGNHQTCVSHAEAGFSMMDALLISAIFGLLIVGYLGVQDYQAKEIARNRVDLTRESILELLGKYVSDTKALAATTAYIPPKTNALGNQLLDYCMNGSPVAGPACAPNCCPDISATPEYFNLIDPMDAAGTRIIAGTDVRDLYSAATTASPARYNGFAELCTTPNKSCFIEVLSSFNASCGTNPAPCNKAASITFHVELREAIDPATSKPYRTGYAQLKSQTIDVPLN